MNHVRNAARAALRLAWLPVMLVAAYIVALAMVTHGGFRWALQPVTGALTQARSASGLGRQVFAFTVAFVVVLLASITLN